MMKRYIKKKPYIPYIAPAMTIMTVLTVFPTIFLYLISITDYQLGWDLGRIRLVWFDNYIRLFSGRDPDFWNAVYISLKFMTITTGIEMVLGFMIGKLLCDSEFKLKPVVFAILIIPIVMTPSIAGNIWKLMLNSEYGIVNYFLNLAGISNVTWLDANLSFTSVVLADVWQWTPFVSLISYAGLCSLPVDQYEAARIDGANAFQIYWRIFMPIMKPQLILVGVLNMITVWNDYLGPLIFLQDRSKFTLALGLASFKGVHSTQIIPMLCITVIMILPPIIVFLFAQKHIVEGTSGAIK